MTSGDAIDPRKSRLGDEQRPNRQAGGSFRLTEPPVGYLKLLGEPI
ncbi:hypothetical protein RAO21_07020 [Pediococcus acidilactici]